ncbi:DNRLRE domain-containing protein [Streptomyces fimicarius]|uniref:DNRLRE domain-containing protein n=1 Tax=Streptomyces griseus TaxID=1911 RepID=UPI00367F393C
MLTNSRWFKAACRVALVMAGVLAAETAMVTEAGAVVVGERAGVHRAADQKQRDAGPDAAPDEASALLAARLRDRRVEVLSERTETSTVWARPDGSMTAEFAAGPVRHWEDGRWQPVDPTLVADADGMVRAKGHPLDLELAGRSPAPPGGPGGEAESTPLIRLDDDESGRALTVGWRGALPKPQLSGSRATYKEALPATDLVVEATRTGFEQYAILKNRSAVKDGGRLRLSLDVQGMKVVERDDGSVAFTDAGSGKQVGVLPAPVMWDARVDGRSQEYLHRAPVAMDVEQQGDDAEITLTPDAAFLADEATRFPVTIDPALNLGTTLTAFVQEGYTSDQSGATELKLGNNGGGQKARSFLKFNTRPIKGKRIESATLKLWNRHSWSCSARAWEVWGTNNFTNAARWTAQPKWLAKWATSTQTKGFSSSCAAGWVTADVKGLAQAWADNGNAENSAGLRATNESDPYTWKRFNSRNAASNVPVIAVTYSTPPTTPTAVTAAPAFVNPTSKSRYVTSLTPTLSAKVTDPDGGNVKAQFEITSNPAGTYSYTATSTNVSSGGTARLTVPQSKKLPAGGAMRLRARGYDGKHYSPWSSYVNFRLNTYKPAAPAVTCERYEPETWSDASGEESLCTLSTTSSDGYGYQWGLDNPAAPHKVANKTGTGGTPLDIKIKPSDGWHTLYARTVDSAGLVSDRTTKMSFGVSKDGVALQQPTEGDRPARRTYLRARAKTEYTQVTYEYRRSDQDTWQTIPAKDVTVPPGDKPIASWPQPVTAGQAVPLVWNMTQTFSQDGPLQVRATFSGAKSLPAGHTRPSRITYDPDAGTAPTSEIGPGDVNLLTGNLAVSESDASAFDLSVTRTANSRKPGRDTARQGQAPIFGPTWVSGIETEITDSDYTGLRKTSDTSVEVTFDDGDEIGFTAAKGGTWRPEVGAEDLTLTGSLTGSFTLTDDEGTVTVFTKAAPTLPTWQVSSSRMPEDNSTTRIVSEKTTIGGKDLARPKYAIAPTSAVKSETCEAAPATKGCRLLQYVYATSTTATAGAFGDYTGRVKEIRLWVTTPGAKNSTSTAIATYAYDDKGQLRETWDPRISPALKTAYRYDTAGRVTSYTPPGELPWTLTYGKAGHADTAGEGMLLTASRPALEAGSAKETNGTATSRVVYDVSMAGGNAPYDLTRKTTDSWGQWEPPTDASAVFPADADPADSDGGDLKADAYRRATVTYMDASGRETNTAQPGGHINATSYDHYGNTVRELTAANRVLALGADETAEARLTALSLIDLSSAERAERLSTATVYSDDGLRVLETSEPVHLAALAAAPDSPVALRKHTVNTYDEGRPTDAKTKNLITTSRTGAAVTGDSQDRDVRVTKTAYNWTLGLATAETKDATGAKLTTRTEYDSQGRVTKTMLPKSNGNDAAATRTSYWTGGGSGSCAGRPEWADQTCLTGPAADITGGGDNPKQLPTTVTEYDRWGNTAKTTETANSQTRTGTTTYDAAGRETSSATTGGQGTAVPAVTTTYDPVNGKKRTVTSSNGTIAYLYDALGRQISYTDADGKKATTAYDLLDRPVTETDDAPSTTTYTYDTSTEPRGLATKVTDSIAGDFTAAYDADGEVTTEHLPGGLTLTHTLDETGNETGRRHARDTDDETIIADTALYNVHEQQTLHSADNGTGNQQHYNYDGAGRLIRTADDQGTRTSERAYTFDNNTNRTKLTDRDGGDGTKETSYTYDSADRLIAAGTTYDAFGRTTRTRTSTTGYYANDLVRQQTRTDTRTTWTLDPAERLASWTSENRNGDTWTPAHTRRNHYTGDGDSPAYTSEGTADDITRNVSGIGNDLSAITSKDGDTVLQLTDLNDNITATYPLDDGASPTVFAADEYGNPLLPGQAPRYGWLGGKQRSAETPTGQILMGQRLYEPTTGRFQQTDPVPGGSANSYDYANADPRNQTDLEGQWSWAKKQWKRVKSFVSRKSRNPNYRNAYYVGRAGFSLINPIKKARYVVRAVKRPRRVARMCGRGVRSAWGCFSAATGVRGAVKYGRKSARNYKYQKAYNQALTRQARESLCRRYTGYRGRGSCS